MKNERIIIKKLKAGISELQSTIEVTNSSIHLHKRVFYQVDIKLIAKISAKYGKQFYFDTKQSFVSIHI